MRNLLIYISFVVFMLFPVCLESTKLPKDEARLREIKEVLWQKAYRAQDTQLLERIMVDAKGNWLSKADELEWVEPTSLHAILSYTISSIWKGIALHIYGYKRK